MSKKTQNTIQTLLRNWLNGDVNAKQSLDQLTNDDPFLNDAMDGYESIEGNHLERLNRLDDRLKERIKSKKNNRVVFLIQRTAAVAAILLLVFGSFWWLDNYFSDSRIVADHIEVPQNTVIEPDPTMSENIEMSSELISENDVKDNKTKESTHQIALAEKKKDFISKNKKKNNTRTVPNATQKKEIDLVENITENSEIITEPEVINNESISESPKVIVLSDETVIESKDAMVLDSEPEIYVDEPEVVYQNETEYASTYSVEQAEVAASIPDVMATVAMTDAALIRGVVYDIENEPVFGASIVELNTENGTISDFDGQFELLLMNTTNQIQVSYIGFKDIVLTPNIDSIYSFVLEPSEDELDAIIISDYSSLASDSIIQYLDTDISVYPKDGYEQFYKYLDEQLLYPQSAAAKQVEGIVKLRFEIDENGTPQNVEVKESVGYGCDEEAIRLLKEGPYWKTKEGATTTDLAIPFRLKEQEQKAKTKKKNSGN